MLRSTNKPLTPFLTTSNNSLVMVTHKVTFLTYQQQVRYAKVRPTAVKSLYHKREKCQWIFPKLLHHSHINKYLLVLLSGIENEWNKWQYGQSKSNKAIMMYPSDISSYNGTDMLKESLHIQVVVVVVVSLYPEWVFFKYWAT